MRISTAATQRSVRSKNVHKDRNPKLSGKLPSLKAVPRSMIQLEIPAKRQKGRATPVRRIKSPGGSSPRAIRILG
jgi:hypothetical protein